MIQEQPTEQREEIEQLAPPEGPLILESPSVEKSTAKADIAKLEQQLSRAKVRVTMAEELADEIAAELYLTQAELDKERQRSAQLRHEQRQLAEELDKLRHQLAQFEDKEEELKKQQALARDWQLKSEALTELLAQAGRRVQALQAQTGDVKTISNS